MASMACRDGQLKCTLILFSVQVCACVHFRAYCCTRDLDECPSDMSFVLLACTVPSSFYILSTFMYNFEDGYHDSYSSEVPEPPPVSVVLRRIRPQGLTLSRDANASRTLIAILAPTFNDCSAIDEAR
ncbi:hypothetical protein BDY19DRAFT_976260, partial [Irpex rosettiformis]